MSVHERIARRAGVGATALGALTCAVAITAGTASAVPTGLSVNARNVYMGCVYQVTASYDSWIQAWFYDNGLVIGGSPITPSNGKATIQWTPHSAGTHTLSTLQGTAWELKVNVLEPTLTGSATCGAGPLGFLGS
ncbi:hypothetical protein [Nocardia seriolae]|uniref:Ig-like domain-containing protein n=1 Tax=Nocardia seriolae TaxID=37332 RepID=A0ABC9YZC5_9NOCA|nr:hypothetical protein [Nocardia seriolae]QUN19088.1 hypothetical protein KEC46_06805 [Nocardia seriolae]WKY51806.1 hypothetical protein Q5P07_33595 [Nocardia seriolae]GAM48926.1 hypothetical protein NS07_v2contig00091-0003 [Nocardia seriolae]GAP30850.1 hypothetical protein NSK11_contig00096-0003 [Nocardia seriolae]